MGNRCQRARARWRYDINPAIAKSYVRFGGTAYIVAVLGSKETRGVTLHCLGAGSLNEFGRLNHERRLSKTYELSRQHPAAR